MIKIFSQVGTLTGSLIALLRLCEELNNANIEAKLFLSAQHYIQPVELLYNYINPRHVKLLQPGQLSWGDFDKNDTVISHYILWPIRPQVKKMILYCQETDLFDLKKLNCDMHDQIVFVSAFQKTWHNTDGLVIPPLGQSLKPVDISNNNIAGIIGSIDSHKQTHISIMRALEDGYKKIQLWGIKSSDDYFDLKIAPFIKDNLCSYMGTFTDAQSVYNTLHSVYCSSLRETYNYVQLECLQTGVQYKGTPENTFAVDHFCFDNKKIIDKWIHALRPPVVTIVEI